MIVAFKAGTEINEDNIGIIEPIAETIPDDDGNYTLNLPPGESYDIYFLCGMEGEDNSGSYTLRGMSLDVFPPANDINFTYDSEGGEITGKVPLQYLEDMLLLKMEMILSVLLRLTIMEIIISTMSLKEFIRLSQAKVILGLNHIAEKLL